MNKLMNIFKKERNIVIGVIHFPPLLGYPDFPGFDLALNNALKDLAAFERGGVDGVIIENNYDIPHKIEVGEEIIKIMADLGKEISKKSKIPIGVSVLWNDYKAALIIAKEIGAKFIRIPVFVDTVETSYGVVVGDPKQVLAFRKEIKAQEIAIFTDIQVKHSKMLEQKTIKQSAKEAIKNKSDAIIVTGKWTGDAPEKLDLEKTRSVVKEFPIIVGSGADENNIQDLLKHANGVIISTSLKEGGSKNGEVNLKSWSQRIAVEKVKRLMNKVRG